MILDFQNVSYAIPNGQKIYENLNFKLFENEYYGVLGKNGSGKSTLIEMIMGMRKLTNGNILVFGENPQGETRRQKNKIFTVTHDMQIPGYIKARDMLDFYALFYPKYSKEIEQQTLELFEIDPNRKFGSLSTGQKIKALLCGAFASRAELYLFDEVTAVLDPKSRRNFFKYLKSFRIFHSCSILLATNIAEDLGGNVDKVIFIDDNHKILIKDSDKIDKLFDGDEDVA